MKIENINFFIFGAPNSGFKAYPKENIKKVEGFDKTITTNEIYCQQFNNADSTKIFYIRYGLASGNEKGIGRLGSNFGFCIELDGYTIKRDGSLGLFTYLDSIFNNIFLHTKLGLLKKEGSNIMYCVDDFVEIESKIDHAISVVSTKFVDDFETSSEPISHNTEYGQFELVPDKIEALAQERERMRLSSLEQVKKSKHSDKKSKKLEKDKGAFLLESNGVADQNKQTHKKLNIKLILILWCTGLTVMSFYLLYQNNSIRKEIKKINSRSVNEKPIGSVIDINDNTLFEEEISGVKKVYLDKQNYLKYLTPNELIVTNSEDMVNSISNYLYNLSSTSKNKFSNIDEIIKTIEANNPTDIAKLSASISSLKNTPKSITINIKEGSNEDLIPDKLLIFQTKN